MKRLAALSFVLIATAALGQAQPSNEILLWPNGAPGALADKPEDKPSLTPYVATWAKPTGAAVIVCPGGGYQHLAPHEGGTVAQWLNSIGIKAFVLKYRLGPQYHHPAMMEDVQRAVRYVRSHAKDYEIDPQRIGIIGFSAGGHIASTAGTHFTAGDANAQDPIERASSRPDLMMLIYPVITMGQFTHGGSKKNLLGDNPSQELVDLMSNDKQITKETPPAFLVHGMNDRTVPVENSLLFADAMRKAGVGFELHVFENAPPHGYGLGIGNPVVGIWPKLAEQWLRGHGF